MNVESIPAVERLLRITKGRVVEVRKVNMTQTAEAKKEVERLPVGRPWLEIYADLRKDIPAAMLSTRQQQGNTLTYISWPDIVKLLHWYAPGWSYSLSVPIIAEDFVTVRATISIPTAEGTISFDALGTEPLFEYRKPKQGETPDENGYVRTRTIGYGSAADRAESSALRRAAGKAGLGLYLWEK